MANGLVRQLVSDDSIFVRVRAAETNYTAVPPDVRGISFACFAIAYLSGRQAFALACQRVPGAGPYKVYQTLTGEIKR